MPGEVRVPDEPRSTRALWRSTLRATWPVPLLTVASVLFVAALVTGLLTRPDPRYDGFLNRADRLIEKEKYDEAIDVLNTEVFPVLSTRRATQDDRRAYHLLLARAIYRGQEALGLDLRANHESVESLYTEAERLNATLTEQDRFALAQTLVSLGKMDEAIAQADLLGGRERENRSAVYRRVVSTLLNRRHPDEDGASALLTRMESDPGLVADDKAWVLARQSEIRLRNGYVGEAIDRLLREIPKLNDAGDGARGELFVMLSEAYVQSGELEEASKNLDRADGLLKGVGPYAARVALLQGRIAMESGRYEDAQDWLTLVIERHSDSDAYLPGLMAMGEAEARMEHYGRAQELYDLLLDEWRHGRTSPEAAPETIAASLLRRARERVEAGELTDALRFAETAEGFFEFEDVPPDVLLAIAQTCDRIAEAGLPKAANETTRFDPHDLDPATRESVVRYFRRAGAYYREHADRMQLIADPRYGDSLWAGARAFDRAGSLNEAIEAYRAYADGFVMDPRQAEARYRLGQAYQARGDYTLAEEYYQGLIDDRQDRASGKGVGPFGDAAYVPLAQCFLEDADADNDVEIQPLLERVLRGDMGGAESENFRRALIELGKLHYRLGDYAGAIERLGEAVARYPEDSRMGELKFLLGDACRLSADAIDQTLEGALLDSERRALLETRTARLGRALGLYAEARDAFARQDPRRRTPLESLYLRNSYFYLGDCAFDLGDYTTAIRHYDTARERYPTEPSSLVAMVQIVNAHVKQGDMERARTADERARRFFRSLPDEVWDDPNLPMKRQDWERWLDSSQRLYKLGRSS